MVNTDEGCCSLNQKNKAEKTLKVFSFQICTVFCEGVRLDIQSGKAEELNRMICSPSFHDVDGKKKGEEEFVFFKQRSADIRVDALCEVVIQILNPHIKFR